MPESDVLPGNIAPNTSRLWTIEQVAQYLQLTPETVRSMARDGEIPAFKIRHRYWRFREEDITQWVQDMADQA